MSESPPYMTDAGADALVASALDRVFEIDHDLPFGVNSSAWPAAGQKLTPVGFSRRWTKADRRMRWIAAGAWSSKSPWSSGVVAVVRPAPVTATEPEPSAVEAMRSCR